MSREPILVVEDERAQRLALQQFLEACDYEVDAVESGEEGLALLAERSYGALLTDLRLPGIDGLEVVRRARLQDEQMGLLLMTAYASIDSAVDALRHGAHDYLLKPLILEDVERKIAHLLEYRTLLRENRLLRRAARQATEHADGLVAESSAMKHVVDWIGRAGRSRAPVLITGETGTGKEVVAQAIHKASAKPSAPFLAINLAAVPENMVASELFGHEKGAFTGAERRREGILRAAGEGTVFLDEIGELSAASQVQLLRALEAREVQPLGSDRTVPFRARVLTATHRDLREMIEAGEFREDLYFRIHVVEIHLPPLHERPDDVPLLVHHLLARHAHRAGAAPPVVSPAAMRVLVGHRWRGNVRELANVLERAMLLADAGRIELEHLPSDLGEHDDDGLGATHLKAAVERFERDHIARVLRACDGNRERAAEALGLSPATLYRRLDRYGLKGYEVNRG